MLVFPSLAAGNAAYKVLAALGGATAIGPILLGVNKPVTVLPRDANVDTIVSMTAYTVARGSTAQMGTLKGSHPSPAMSSGRQSRPTLTRSLEQLVGVGRLAGAALARRRAGEVDRRAVEREERLLRLARRRRRRTVTSNGCATPGGTRGSANVARCSSMRTENCAVSCTTEVGLTILPLMRVPLPAAAPATDR